MAVSYKKLFKMLIDRDMKKKDFRELTGISGNTVSKLANNENVTMEVIEKICVNMCCTVDDIVEIIPDECTDNGTSKKIDSQWKGVFCDMERREYSAGAVKHSFWFMEFRKVVQLLSEGKTLDEIKKLNQEENIFGAPTVMRATQIFNTVSARIKMLDESFYPVFVTSEVSTQKLFNLVATMAYDTLFGEFVYEVIREKMIIGNDEFADSDIRVFFKNKQLQDEKVAEWTDATLKRLGACFKTLLYEAGMTDKGKECRKILKPILDPVMANWLKDHDMELMVKALTGVR